MDLKLLSVQQLSGFLLGRRVPGSDLVFPEDAVRNLCENGIDGPNLLLLMEDQVELKCIIPNTVHRIPLKRSVTSVPQETLNEDMSILVEEHPALAMFNTGSYSHSNKENIEVVKNIVEVSPSRSLTPLRKVIPGSEYGSNSTASNSTASNINNEASRPKVSPSGSKREHQEDSDGLPRELPLPGQFSIKVEEAIGRDDVPSVQLQIIKDAGNFFYGLCKHPKQGDYTRMAKKLCERFPELRDVNSDTYWKSVQHQLSMYFRNQRRCSNDATQSTNKTKRFKTSAKKLKIGDDAVARKRNMELLKTTKSSDFAAGTYKKLIDDTCSCRRAFIKHEAKSTKQILEECPFLSKPEHVLCELQRVIGKPKVEEAKNNLATGLKGVLMISSQLYNKEIMQAIAIIERRTKKKSAGKLMTFLDVSTPPEKLFKSKIVEFRIVCTGTPESTGQVFISGEDDAIFECPTNDLLDALIYLIGSYYVFDVSYPLCYQGVLCFLQDVGLCCFDDCYRGSKYNVFLAEVKKNIHSM